MTATWQRNCSTRYAVGNMPTAVFTFVPHALHPMAVPTAITVTVKRPDGSTFGSYSPPDASLTVVSNLEDVAGVSTEVTEVTFEFPAPMDVGSKRKPWLVTCVSTAGVVGSKTSQLWVDPS